MTYRSAIFKMRRFKSELFFFFNKNIVYFYHQLTGNKINRGRILLFFLTALQMSGLYQIVIVLEYT